MGNMSGKGLFTFGWTVLILSILFNSCTNEVTFKSLINEMTSRENLTYFPEKEYTHQQSSSYNRASVSPDKPGWYENFDMSHFLRVENQYGRREFVMLDVAGPGAIVRWWMTFYKAQNGMLRIYIDNDSIPALKGSPNELLSGTLLTGPPLAVSVQAGAPIGEEGRDYDHNLYVPIPFSKHCKITYECDSLVLRYENEGVKVPQGYYWPDVFYNIGCRRYSKNVKIESFSMQALKDARPFLEDAGKKLLNSIVTSEPIKDFEKLILPGDSLVIEFSEKQHAVNRLIVELEALNVPQALRSTVLHGSFDGYATIWAPIGEFFGTGYSLNPHKTWMNQRDEKGRMESFWIMPFRKKCTLVIINYGSENIRLKGSIGLSPYKWKANSMYFGSMWHEYYHIKTRNEKGSPFDLNFIDIRGKGVYTGDQITLFNNTYEWWGEGDEKIFVDREPFPSSFGTGSEDYYGYSFARQESFSHPFLSQPTGIGNMNWGETVNMRHRSLDAIPFKTFISSNIELWHWANITINYALTTYYYILPPFNININPDIESVKRPVVLSKIDFTLDEK
jgi:hypothetical protein